MMPPHPPACRRASVPTRAAPSQLRPHSAIAAPTCTPLPHLPPQITRACMRGPRDAPMPCATSATAAGPSSGATDAPRLQRVHRTSRPLGSTRAAIRGDTAQRQPLPLSWRLWLGRQQLAVPPHLPRARHVSLVPQRPHGRSLAHGCAALRQQLALRPHLRRRGLPRRGRQCLLPAAARQLSRTAGRGRHTNANACAAVLGPMRREW